MTSAPAVVRGISMGLVPFDAGREGWRMGSGPDALLNDDFRGVLERHESDLRIAQIRPDTDWRTELKTTLDLQHLAAPRDS